MSAIDCEYFDQDECSNVSWIFKVNFQEQTFDAREQAPVKGQQGQQILRHHPKDRSAAGSNLLSGVLTLTLSSLNVEVKWSMEVNNPNVKSSSLTSNCKLRVRTIQSLSGKFKIKHVIDTVLTEVPS